MTFFSDLINSVSHNDIELLNTLNLIDTIPYWSRQQLAPLPLIKTVNYLFQLGFDKSLAALFLYCDIIDRREERLATDMEEGLTTDEEVQDFLKKPAKVFSAARLLFVSKNPNTVLPELWIGRFDIMPKDKSLFPLFPLTIYRDIPWSLANLYVVLGCPQTPQEYLEWCSQEGKLNAA
jgi:hypothetical protein